MELAEVKTFDMAETTAGSLMVPLFTWNTTWALSPDCLGSALFKRAYAFVESVPGRLNESLNFDPNDCEMPVIAMKAINQTAMTINLWRKAKRPSFFTVDPYKGFGMRG